MSQKSFPLLYRSVNITYDCTRVTNQLNKSCIFQVYLLCHLFIGIFNFCIFPPNICRILCDPEYLLAIFPRFCDFISWKMNLVNAYLDLRAYQLQEIAEKLKKSEGWVVEWSSRNDGFEDKKRTRRMKILKWGSSKNFEESQIQKGKLDQAAPTTVSKQRPCWGKYTIWRFMKSEGWRPLRWQKKPALLTAKQREARLKFAKQYKNLTAEDWDYFPFFGWMS